MGPCFAPCLILRPVAAAPLCKLPPPRNSLALFHRGPKELLMLLLDPSVPLAWVLPQGLERCFGATPRLGVQPLAVRVLRLFAAADAAKTG